MEKKTKHIFLLLFSICIILIFVNSKSEEVCTKDSCSDSDGNMNLAVVACGDRLEETLIMIKSAVLFSLRQFTVHIFADSDLHEPFKMKLSSLPSVISKKFNYVIHKIQFPSNQNTDEWRKLFKECASQRLFLPEILVDLDFLLYVDTDILFLRPLDDIWLFFNQFNSTQIAAMSPEHEEASAAWYNRFARHPYVPPLGINSGVMLMNLKKMRSSNWLERIVGYFKKHQYDITWGDQDLINIYFHYFPEQLYQFTCDWNYRPDHCMYSSTCKMAEQNGVSILHGNRGVFHNDKQLIFKNIFDAFQQYDYFDNINKLILSIENNVLPNIQTNCGHVVNVITKQLKISILNYTI